MLIIDAHLDLAWNALQYQRDLTASAHTLRTREWRTPGEGRAAAMVALPDLRQGRIALAFGTVFARCTGQAAPNVDWESQAQAYAVAQSHVIYYQMLEYINEARLVTNRAELDSHLSAWEAAQADDAETPLPGIVISMESADPITEPDELESWWEDGLRVIGPAHFGPGRYAGGTASELGLTDMGQELLEGMDELGFILDLTHLSDKAFWEAIEQFDGSILASHSNCRALVPHQRQFSDDQLKALIERDGVIGATLPVWMLKPGWTEGDDNAGITLEMVVDHIDHVCQLAGNSHHAAIGSDLDGGFGREQAPADMDTIADLQTVPTLLEKRGYSAEDIAAIMHGNWLRLLHETWGEA